MNHIKDFFCKYKNDIFVIILLLSLYIFLAVFLGPLYGHLYIDNGREAYLPELILKGKLLYKDIFSMYNPLSYYINAFLYLVFGIKYKVLYIFSYVNAFAILFGIYLICRQFVSKFYSASAVIAIMCFYIYGNVLGIVSYISPYSYAFVYAVTFFTYSVYFFLLYIKTDKLKFAYISALLYGLAFANKPEFLLCPLAMAVMLFIKREKLSVYFIYILLIVLPTIFCYSIMFLRGFTIQDLYNYIKFSHDFLTAPEQLQYTASYIMPEFNMTNLKMMFKYTLIFLEFIVLTFIQLKIITTNKYLSIFGISLLPFYFIFVNGVYEEAIQEIQYVNFLSAQIFVLVPVMIYKSFKIKDKKDIMLFFTGIIGILSMSRIGFWPLTKYGYGIYSILPVTVLFLYFATAKYEEKAKKLLAISFAIVALNYIFAMNEGRYVYPFRYTDTGKFQMYAEEYIRSVFLSDCQWVSENTNPQDSVLVMPEGIMLNHVTNRDTNPKYYHLIPNHITALGEQNIINGLNENKPDYIITNNLQYAQYGKKGICEDFGLEICDFIAENYDYVNSHSDNCYDLVFKSNIYRLKQKK